MLTAEIAKYTTPSPLHQRSNSDLKGQWVSATSRWHDQVWQLDNPTPGQALKLSRMRWDVELLDGSLLTDEQHTDMLDWLRRFSWSLFVEPGDGAGFLKPGSAGVLSRGIAYLARWMDAHAFKFPHQLDENALDAYVTDMPDFFFRPEGTSDEKDSSAEEERLTVGQVFPYLLVIRQLWQQRHVLARAGIRPLPRRPWPDEAGANSVAQRIAEATDGWIQPVPDEVAIPLLNSASRMIGTPANDVIALQELCKLAYERSAGNHPAGPGVTNIARAKRQNEAARKFCFSIIQGETTQWHPPLGTFVREDGKSGAIFRLMQLIRTIQASCIITIQSCTGMRASEICALRSGINPATGLPVCVRIERSASGLSDVFMLRSELSKTEPVPTEVDWLIGTRPSGSNEVPLAVRAIVVLNQLLSDYRDLADTDLLLVSTKPKTGLPKTALGIGRFTVSRLQELIKEFMSGWVDLSNLPDESAHSIEKDDLVAWKRSRGRILRSHQLRKTYAMFALSVDSRLLPAVQRQFHHISQQMTESGYWGPNRIQVEPINAVASQQTALFFYELARGKLSPGGKMGENIERHIGDLRSSISGLPNRVAWAKTIKYVENNNLHLWFAPHGKCLPLDPSRMRCHEASGTFPIGARLPNYSSRQPSLCAGCDSFIVDARHAGFWEDRYIQNESAIRLYESSSKSAPKPHIGPEVFRVIKARADQARKLLKHMGIDAADLEHRVLEAQSRQ